MEDQLQKKNKRVPSFCNLQLEDKQIEFIYKSLGMSGMVRIYNLGVFTIKKMKGRKFYNHMLNHECVTEPRIKLQFRPFTKTKERIQKL